MINPFQMRELVREVLNNFESKLWSKEAEELLLGTMAVESDFGYHLHQISGPGQGPFSIEPATEKSIWEHHLKYRVERAGAVQRVTGVEGCGTTALGMSLDYQIIMARLKYRTCPGRIPESLPEQAHYWNQNYNCNPIYGTDQEYIHKYNKYVK